MNLKRYATAFLAITLLLLVTTDGLAQEQDRRGRRGGFRGGPGGGSGDPTMGLLRDDKVKAELDISEEQQAALDKLADRDRPDLPRRDVASFRDMSDEERKVFAEKMQKDFAERAQQLKENLEEILLPGQMERLEQISLQVVAPTAERCKPS